MTPSRSTTALVAGLILAAVAPAADIRGLVTRVDLDNKELLLEAHGHGLNGAVLRFALPDQTVVLFGNQPGKLTDLTTGARVRIQYEAADGRQTAQTIHVLSGPKPAAPAVSVTPDVPPVPVDADALTGVLRHVGYSDREVVVIGPGAKGPQTETTVAVPETARIVKNGKEATLDDLKEGDGATVQVEQKDGHPSAVAIQVGAGAGPAAAANGPGSKAIPKIRLILKIVDQVLEQMDRNHEREP